MRFLVVGGTGAIGWWVVRRLSGRGHKVTVVHRGRTEVELAPEVTHLHGEVGELKDSADLACDAAIHMYAPRERDASDVVGGE